MDHSYEDLRRAASDPSTDWETLHRIAEDYPEFRPEVASNPATYPELIEALAELGDPAIDEALARRFSPEIFADEDPDEPETETAEESPEEEAESAAAGEAEPEGDTEGSEAFGSSQPAPTSTIDTILGDDSPRGTEATDALAVGADGGSRADRKAAKKAQKRAKKQGAAQAATRQTAEQGSAVGPIAVADPHAQTAGQGVEGRGGSRMVTIMLMVVMPLAVLVVIAALVINTLAQDVLTEDAQIAEGGTTMEDDEEEPEDEDLPADLDEARTAMQELSSSSQCEDPQDDSRIFGAFASFSAEEDAWEEDSPTVRQALEGLQDECGSVYAAQVHQQLTTEDEDTPENLASTVEWLGTDWLTVAYDAPGAQELTAFASPTGNVVCEMDEALTCTVLDHTFETPEGCEDGATYAIRLDESATPDCENPVSGEETQVLAYGDSAGNEYFACTSYQSQMSCWNKLTGEGINLSSSRNSTW